MIIDRESEIQQTPAPAIPDQAGDHHLVISVILLLSALLFLNPIVVSCSAPAVIFSTRVSPYSCMHWIQHNHLSLFQKIHCHVEWFLNYVDVSILVLLGCRVVYICSGTSCGIARWQDGDAGKRQNSIWFCHLCHHWLDLVLVLNRVCCVQATLRTNWSSVLILLKYRTLEIIGLIK